MIKKTGQMVIAEVERSVNESMRLCGSWPSFYTISPDDWFEVIHYFTGRNAHHNPGITQLEVNLSTCCITLILDRKAEYLMPAPMNLQLEPLWTDTSLVEKLNKSSLPNVLLTDDEYFAHLAFIQKQAKYMGFPIPRRVDMVRTPYAILPIIRLSTNEGQELLRRNGAAG